MPTSASLADRVAMRFGTMIGVKPRLLIRQALLAYDSEQQTGHGVDWVLAAGEPIATALRTLVRTKPETLHIEDGDVNFQLVIDATEQPDPELQRGPFLVGKILGEQVDRDVLATLCAEKQIAGRQLLIFSGQLV